MPLKSQNATDRRCRYCRHPLPADADPRRRTCSAACRQTGYRRRVKAGTAGSGRTLEVVADRLLTDAMPEGECLIASSTTPAGVPALVSVTVAEGERRRLSGASVVFLAEVDPDTPLSVATYTACGDPACLRPSHLRRGGRP